MPYVNSIIFPTNVTSFEFYNNIMPQIKNHFENKLNHELVFDFNDVNYLNALVIPNLLVVGRIIKDYYKAPVKLVIPWKPDILTFFSDIGFFKVNTAENIFDVDERYIGGYDTNVYTESKLYSFRRESLPSKSNIGLTTAESITTLKKAFNTDYSATNENLITNIIALFEELIWNSIEHGESDCYACFQTNIGKNTRYKKAYIAISDMGHGFYRTLTSKPDAGDKRTEYLRDIQHDDDFLYLASIIGAVMYRREMEKFGIYDVINWTFKRNGTVRIHTENTQVILTKNTALSELSRQQAFEHFIDVYKRGSNSDTRYANIRIAKERLTGVHYEFEIPLESGQ